MKIRVQPIVVIIGLISLMSFLYFKTNAIDSAEHNRCNNQLRYLKEMDVVVDKDVLEARRGLSSSYDRLIEEIGQINALQANIRDIPAFVDENGRVEINRRLD